MESDEDDSSSVSSSAPPPPSESDDEVKAAWRQKGFKEWKAQNLEPQIGSRVALTELLPSYRAFVGPFCEDFSLDSFRQLFYDASPAILEADHLIDHSFKPKLPPADPNGHSVYSWQVEQVRLLLAAAFDAKQRHSEEEEEEEEDEEEEEKEDEDSEDDAADYDSCTFDLATRRPAAPASASPPAAAASPRKLRRRRRAPRLVPAKAVNKGRALQLENWRRVWWEYYDALNEGRPMRDGFTAINALAVELVPADDPRKAAPGFRCVIAKDRAIALGEILGIYTMYYKAKSEILPPTVDDSQFRKYSVQLFRIVPVPMMRRLLNVHGKFKIEASGMPPFGNAAAELNDYRLNPLETKREGKEEEGTPNAKICVSMFKGFPGVHIEATAPILPGEEIRIDYGDRYPWEQFLAAPDAPPAASPLPARRGRPRKGESKSKGAASPSLPPSSPSPSPRRGRPRKSESKSEGKAILERCDAEDPPPIPTFRCPICHATIQRTGAKFCPRMGCHLNPLCRSCRHPLLPAPDDKFCCLCGAEQSGAQREL